MHTTLSEQQQVETIQGLYEAFGRGDVDHIVSQLTDNVKWIIHMPSIVPWSGDYSGKSSVPVFFERIFANAEVLGFDPQEFVTEGNTVVSMGTFTAKANSTGKSAESRWVFVWKFEGDKISSYEQFHSLEAASIFEA